MSGNKGLSVGNPMARCTMLLLLVVPACFSLNSVGRRSVLCGLAASAAPLPAARAAEERPAGAPPQGAAGLIPGAQTYYVNAPRQLVVATDAAREASLLSSDFVVCGEHHNLAADHVLEASLLRAMADAADRDGVPLVLGLEMVERAFQPALDAYSARTISDAELYTATEWATRWVWPWEQYLPILQLARERNVGLVALNTDTEVLRRVPVEGLESLDAAQRASLVPDPEGFVSATRVRRVPVPAPHAANSLLSFPSACQSQSCLSTFISLTRTFPLHSS